MGSRTVRARLDTESETALRLLLSLGMNESEAVRAALIEAAERRTSDEALRADAERLAADPEDREMIRRLREDMDQLLPELPPE